MKTQMLFQKITTYVVFAICVIMFAYALGIMTDPYMTLYNAIDPELDIDSKGQFAPAFYFYDAQEYADTFITMSIWLIISALPLFFVNMARRRKYYIGNIVATAVVSVYAVVLVGWAIPNISANREIYNAIDVVELEKVLTMKGFTFVEPSMMWFDLGYVFCALLLVSIALLIFNLIWKFILMKKESVLLRNSSMAESVSV